MPTFPAYAVVSTKDRSESNRIRNDQPMAGSGYSIKEFSGGVTEWSFDVVVSRGLSQYFDAWFYENENEWFDFSVRTEFGMQTVEAHFTADGIPQLKSEQANALTYSMKVVTRGAA